MLTNYTHTNAHTVFHKSIAFGIEKETEAHSILSKYLSSICYMPGTAPGTEIY